MEVTFDIEKDRKNRAKHGMSLADAAMFEWDTLRFEVDARRDYGEIRCRGYAFIEDRLYAIAFTFRDESIRVISLRKANNREMDEYEQA
ncbi:hypothetical protein C9I57_09730 [Trinickia symbiotica]|uniref:BrnT family toxin n=1 Tax=Trinickia symbiotica TaxID=863227 RepID=A0A2T3XWW5_9BURK|nr:BrnT family toxin [Trinickia symbiotica]PTB20995.1 hypothetical protein C9I57_09730 [Trinickia symbiotica]